MPRPNETKLPDKVIAKAVKRHLEGKESVIPLAKEYGVSRATFYNWIDSYKLDLLEGARLKTMSPAAIKKSVVINLKTENGLLKSRIQKLETLVAELMLKQRD